MFRFLKKKKRPHYYRQNEQPIEKRKSDDLPKNGPLALKTGIVLLIMFGLAYGNYSLIIEPSDTVKNSIVKENRFVASRRVEFPAQPAGSSSGHSYQGSPEFSFYKNLEAPEEHNKLLNDPNALLIPETDNTANESATDSNAALPRNEAISHSEKLITDRSGVRSLAGSRERKNYPGKHTDAKRYTVQVGAFSQPQVARGWASRWKRRGYKVMLKPVARPSTGVIYRLYLGDFKSEKEADKLVKKLRINEGITAFRLVLK